MTLTKKLKKLHKIATDEHERNCLNDFDDCSICQFLEQEIVAEFDDIHKIVSAIDMEEVKAAESTFTPPEMVNCDNVFCTNQQSIVVGETCPVCEKEALPREAREKS